MLRRAMAPIHSRGDGAPHGHPHSWLLWAGTAGTLAISTRNPVYLALLALAAGVVLARVSRRPMVRSPGAGSPPGLGALLPLGLLLALLAAAVTPLLVHQGATPAFTLPSLELPSPVDQAPPLVLGGVVTWESVVYGLGTGLGLLAILLVFAALAAAVEPYRLLRTLPPAFARSGVVVSIALGFVPQMLTAQREIREAQTLRGHRFRRLRDLGPLFVVLLSEGLERSLALAESLEARGFGGAGRPSQTDSGAAPTPRTTLRTRLLLALGVMIAGAAWITARPTAPWGRWVLALGVLSAVAILWRHGRRSKPRGRRPLPWSGRSRSLALLCVAALAVWFGAHGLPGHGLAYSPYPVLAPPPVHSLPLVALALLTAPLAVHRPRRNPRP